jgi:hypothetical protein
VRRLRKTAAADAKIIRSMLKAAVADARDRAIGSSSIALKRNLAYEFVLKAKCIQPIAHDWKSLAICHAVAKCH